MKEGLPGPPDPDAAEESANPKDEDEEGKVPKHDDVDVSVDPREGRDGNECAGTGWWNVEPVPILDVVSLAVVDDVVPDNDEGPAAVNDAFGDGEGAGDGGNIALSFIFIPVEFIISSILPGPSSPHHILLPITKGEATSSTSTSCNASRPATKRRISIGSTPACARPPSVPPASPENPNAKLEVVGGSGVVENRGERELKTAPGAGIQVGLGRHR